MALRKKNEFDQANIELAEFARICSHPARIAILKELAGKESCICGEIVSVLPLAQSTVSQHLKEMMNAGIIKGTLDGTRSCYCIDADEFRRLSNAFAAFTQEIDNQCISLDCC